jgi:hypothetical protein
MATTINQANAIRQLYQLVTVPSCTRYLTARVSLYDAKSRHLGRALRKVIQFRWSRGSDLRLLRLTMNGLLDRHIWGATPCIKDRPRPKVRPHEA